MKLNINIFRRKQREEAYKDKYLNGRKPEGTAHKAVYISRENHEAVRRIVTEHLERHGTELENLYRKKSHDAVGQITISR